MKDQGQSEFKTNVMDVGLLTSFQQLAMIYQDIVRKVNINYIKLTTVFLKSDIRRMLYPMGLDGKIRDTLGNVIEEEFEGPIGQFCNMEFYVKKDISLPYVGFIVIEYMDGSRSLTNLLPRRISEEDLK